MNSCVFDLDGVLVDTHDIVRQAYAEVGVHMPPTAWGKPWREWLIEEMWGDEKEAEQVHAAKNKIYIEKLRHSEPPQLPAADVARMLCADDVPVTIITGASFDAAQFIVVNLRLPMEALAGTSMSELDKVTYLRMIHNDSGVYVDDDTNSGRRIAKAADWQYVNPNGKTKDELMNEILSWIA